MGYWTYNYACIHQKKSTQECMRYDGEKPIVLALPDGTFLEERNYNGYGDICGNDIHELVVDWNRGTPEALAIIDKHIADLKQEQKEKLEKNDPDDEFRLNIIAGSLKSLVLMREYIQQPEDNDITAEIESKGIEKREVGIQIATYDWELEMLKYPIKFVKNKKYTYDQIKGYSSSTQ